MTDPKTEPADEAEVLFPDKQMRINDEIITVREFSFADGLRASSIAGPILKDLADLFTVSTPERKANYSDMATVFAKHADAYLELIAISIGKSIDWLRTLGGADGDELSLIFWNVNKGFFMRRLVMEAIARRQPAEGASVSASSPSS